MINITRAFINEVHAFLDRGSSPLDIARSMGTNIDTIVYVIVNFLS